jgi:hypothetical protein
MNKPAVFRPKDVRFTAPIVFTPGRDFMRIDRGVEWGIKITSSGDWKFVSIFSRAPDLTYGFNGPAQDLMMLDNDFDAHSAEYSSLQEWLAQRIVPGLNKWLAAAFPPVTVSTSLAPAPIPRTLVEQADLLIRDLRITAGPDGTLTASAG